MNFENIFVPKIVSTSEPAKATVKTTTLVESSIQMPDGEVINENLETTTVENIILVPKSSETSEEKFTDIFPWNDKTKDIILMSLLGACLLLAIVLGVVIYKWRKEKVHVVNGFDMLSRGSSVSVFNSTKIE